MKTPDLEGVFRRFYFLLKEEEKKAGKIHKIKIIRQQLNDLLLFIKKIDKFPIHYTRLAQINNQLNDISLNFVHFREDFTRQAEFLMSMSYLSPNDVRTSKDITGQEDQETMNTKNTRNDSLHSSNNETKPVPGETDSIIHKRREYDIGIVIALIEEFREIFPRIDAEPVYFQDIKQYCYIFEEKFGENVKYNCVVTFIGGVGPEKAGIVGDRLMQRFKPATIINIGLAGSLDSDVKIGDVIVAEQVDNYLYSGKITDGKSNAWPNKILLSGDPYKSDPDYIAHTKNFEFVFPSQFERWSRHCAKNLESLISEAKLRGLIQKNQVEEKPGIHIGNIASGPIVVATELFAQWLKNSRDRKYLAIEMEAAGIMCAAYTRAIPALVIRGISDYSDERKKDFDNIDNGVLRRYLRHDVA